MNLSNIAEFEQIFRKNYKSLCSFAYQFLKDKEDAKEVVQSVFVDLWQNRNNIKIKTSIESYLLFCVKNRCLNIIKHIKIREKYKEENFLSLTKSNYSVTKNYEKNELLELLWLAVMELPEKRRQIFILSKYENLTNEQIAEKLGISIKTVENQMTAAIKFLKFKLTKFLIFTVFAIGEYLLTIVLQKK